MIDPKPKLKRDPSVDYEIEATKLADELGYTIRNGVPHKNGEWISQYCRKFPYSYYYIWLSIHHHHRDAAANDALAAERPPRKSGEMESFATNTAVDPRGTPLAPITIREVSPLHDTSGDERINRRKKKVAIDWCKRGAKA